jgi:hypothetical protein
MITVAAAVACPPRITVEEDYLRSETRGRVFLEGIGDAEL